MVVFCRTLLITNFPLQAWHDHKVTFSLGDRTLKLLHKALPKSYVSYRYISCCLTNCLKTQWFNNNKPNLPHFLWIRDLEVAWLVALAQRCKTAASCQPGLQSSQGWAGVKVHFQGGSQVFVANSVLTKVSFQPICSPIVNLHWLETCLQVTCYYEGTQKLF